MGVHEYHIELPQTVLDDLKDRLERTRWPDEVEGAGWDYGTNLGYLRELVSYWRNEYDWREQEARLNELPHFMAEVDGLAVHFIQVRSKGKATLPLVLLHGWPGSFLQMLKILPLLTTPRNGARFDSFDVVVPSLPGFGFSQRSRQGGMSVPRMAEIIGRLMTEELGYERFGARGSDLGAGVAQQLAVMFPKAVVGMHLSGSNPYIPVVPDHLTRAEEEFVARARSFVAEEGAYALEQSTKPQTLSYSLNDSPAGLAAWIVEKYRSWSDCSGDVEKRFSKDALLSNIMVYWATGTIGSSMRTYYESSHLPPSVSWGRPTVPAGLAMFPQDIAVAPKEWEDRSLNVRRWTEMPRGGHFPEWEEPELLAEDVRIFFNELPL
jgi:pimeloyl-ACP methyl ester carboxylesterase